MKTNKIISTYIEKICTFLVILMPISIAIGRGVADINLSFVAFLFLLYLVVKRDFSFLKEAWVKAALVLWGYVVINSAFRDNYADSLSKTLPFIRLIFFAICFQFVVNRGTDIDKRIFLVLAIVVCFLVIDGYIQFFLGKDMFGRPKIFDNMGNYEYYRLTGPFSKRVLGAVVMILSPVIFSMLLYKIKEFPKKSILFLCPILLIEVLIFLTGERAALIQSIMALVILCWYIYRNEINIKVFILGILCVLIVLYFIVPKDLIIRHLDSIRILKLGSKSAYGMLWKASWLIGIENPIFGVGARNFQEACKVVVEVCNYHSHNVYLEMFSEFGLVGLFLFCVLLYTLFKEIYYALKYKYKNHDLNHGLILGISVSIFIKLLPFLPSSGFFKNWYAIPLWFMVGWMLYLSKKNKKEKNSLANIY